MSTKSGFLSFIMTSAFFSGMLLYPSRNGTVKCSQLYGCVDYRYFINYLINSPRGKVPQICRNMVHFPGKKGEMAVKSTFSGESAPKKREYGSLSPKDGCGIPLGAIFPGTSVMPIIPKRETAKLSAGPFKSSCSRLCMKSFGPYRKRKIPKS